ncbi:PqqD family protein [Streptomyces mayteni]
MVLDLRTGAWLHLNEVAAEFWSRVAGGLGPDEALVSLAREHRVDPGRLRSDLDALLDVLVSRRLLEWVR